MPTQNEAAQNDSAQNDSAHNDSAHNDSASGSMPAPNATHCIYCQKALRPDEVIRWGFDEIPVCIACYKTLDALKGDRIAAYQREAEAQRRKKEWNTDNTDDTDCH